MDDLTSDRWGIWTTILENLTWNGHQDSVIWEWVAKDGAGDRHYNAHNAFFGVTYNNGFIAGLLLVAYTALAFIRALRYYWAHRKESPTPRRRWRSARCSFWWVCSNRFTRRSR